MYDSFKTISFNQGMHVTVNEVLSLVHSLESGKSAGLDGLNGECLKYADVILSVLLSFCFTCMFKHSYLPSAMTMTMTMTMTNVLLNINAYSDSVKYSL